MDLNMILCALCFVILPILTSAKDVKEEIVMTHILYRHGDRSPIVNFETNNYSESDWPQGFSQLTTIGMQQHFELGKFLRNKYMESPEHKLLNSSYDRHEIEVRSTDVERTLMSAYCNLAGLYPPSGDQIWNKDLFWQPIPVHTVPKSEDNLLHMDSKCPKYNKVYNEVLESDEVVQLRENYKEFFAFVANKTKKSDLDISNIWEIHDVIFCESQHNFTLPDWVHKTFYGKTVFDILNDMNSIQFDLQYNRRTEARLKGGSLLFKIITDINSMVEKSGEVKKAYIYSAHDDTMSAFLSSLKVFDRVSPSYASCAMVDIFQTSFKNGSTDHYVVISYKNDTKKKPVQFQIPGCDVKCPLSKFLELTKENSLSDWKTECQLDAMPVVPDYINIAVLASLGILIVILLFGCCQVIHKKERSYSGYGLI